VIAVVWQDGRVAAAGGVRARHRAAVESDIVDSARRQLATTGAAALSLRAVARDLGMVSSALYRYVASRDELLTLLIVHAFTSLGDAVEAAHDAEAAEALDARWRAIGRSLRRWALDHPHEYALLYGSPVPDYQAPADRTNDPGTRVLALLAGLLADASRAGKLARDAFTPHLTEDLGGAATAAAGTLLDDPFLAGSGLDADTLMAGLAAWSLVMGTLSAEVFGQLGPDTVADPDAWFEYHLEVARRLVLRA
jgi:AcrR family transcriptional regulator